MLLLGLSTSGNKVQNEVTMCGSKDNGGEPNPYDLMQNLKSLFGVERLAAAELSPRKALVEKYIDIQVRCAVQSHSAKHCS
jgi:hypothetical protein